jgi:AraC-like DNA-binding protein
MRRRGTKRKNAVMILIDEAWKLIEKNRGLETVVREGRKYGVGLITSSQLLHDTNTNILSNIATVFIFKTTNGKSLETLSKSFNLSEKELRSIQNLDLGSCFVIQLHKSGMRSAFIIRRIIGIRDTHLIKIKTGAGMEIRISVTEFDEMVASLCGRDKSASVKEAIKENGINLPSLVAKLIENGAERREILMKLQKIGFSNSSIADAFSIAISRMSL